MLPLLQIAIVAGTGVVGEAPWGSTGMQGAAVLPHHPLHGPHFIFHLNDFFQPKPSIQRHSSLPFDRLAIHDPQGKAL